MSNTWLPAVMQASSSEIYVFERATLNCVGANPAACANLQLSAAQILGKNLFAIARQLTAQQLAPCIDELDRQVNTPVCLDTMLTRNDGSIYPIELRLVDCIGATPPVLIAIGNDHSVQRQSESALLTSERRFQAIVSSTPGLVFQFTLGADDSIEFDYLSDACHALLGIDADELRRCPARFMELIQLADRSGFLTSMRNSAAQSKSWNWEGRVRVAGWNDIKWINLRATPRLQADGSVQAEGIMTNISQSKQEEADVRQSRAQLVELSAHIDAVKEQERTRIAREIHDDLGGNLTAIKMALALLSKRLPIDAADDLRQKAVYLDQLVDRTIESVHRIAGDLRPGILDCGLVAAIEWQAREFEKQAGIPCSCRLPATDIDLQPAHATAVFRIFQETLTNISKHAQASQVNVKLATDQQLLRLQVDDDGRGMHPTLPAKPNSFGIRGMIERAKALGGTLSVNDRAQGGCRMLLMIPLPLSATLQS